MTIPEKDGTKNCTFSLQKTYSLVDVWNKRHNSRLCELWRQQDSVALHTPESPEPDCRLLLPSSGGPADKFSLAVPPVMLSSFILACAGLPERLAERLREWLRLPLRCLRCLLLRGLELRDLIFMTTVLSSSELKSELSEELLSCSEVGSWIWWEIKKKKIWRNSHKIPVTGCTDAEKPISCNSSWLTWH